MKRGFTLIELLAVIIILSVIGAVVLPIVSGIVKNNKEQLYKSQLQEIAASAEKWAYKHMDLLPSEGNSITLTVYELKREGLLPINIRNPKNNEVIPNDMQIIISKNNKIYQYVVNEESGTNVASEVNENSPIIILHGNPLEYTEIGSVYQELGAIAKDKDDNDLEVTTVYNYNGSQIANINTSAFNTYTVNYSASVVVNSKTYVSNITRTIIIRDTTNPVLTVPESATITISEASTFDLLDGVTVVDNSGESIQVVTSNLDLTVGKQIITYSACDSHNNCESKRRIINITN